MSRNFKVSYNDGSSNKEVFVVKPFSEDFKSLVEEIQARKPESRNKSLKCYYEGELHTTRMLHNIRKTDDVTP